MTKKNIMKPEKWMVRDVAFDYNMYMLAHNYGVKNNLLVK